MMDELLDQFLIESRDLIAQAAGDFAALDADPHDRGALDSAFRAMHTLKGSVALFDLQPAERVLHAAETVLELARKGTVVLTGGHLAALLACLDQIDRWVDEFERSGGLGSAAAAIADDIHNQLEHPISNPPPPGEVSSQRDDGGGSSPDTPSDPLRGPPPPRGEDLASWLDHLRIREAAVLAAANQPLTAFRYTPDRDCFFRGDDPLAVVAAIPDLISLAVLPEGGAWPDPADIDPFACVTILEGLSTAPHDKVTAAFRLMPDQVSFAQIDPATPTPSAAPQQPRRSDRLLRVDQARIDALGDALGDLLIAVTGIAPLADRAEPIDHDFAAQIRAVQADLERVTAGLRRTVSAVRSVELEPTLRRLPRLAREIADSLGKPVAFTIDGHGIEVDKQIADGLFEPLLHLVRNAIDHGIEPPARRLAAGKPETGRITLSFSRQGDTIVAQLADDGAGIDTARVKQTAVERGLLSASAAAALSPADAHRLIFAAGFSTAETLTTVSGRGVGMDAVEAAVKALRGTIELDSTPGAGTTFRLRLPASTLTTRLLIVEAGGERYGVALDQIVETIGLDRAKLLPIGDGVACVLHGKTLPVLELATLLGSEQRGASHGPHARVLVTDAGGERVGLRVTSFAGRIDSLVRPRSGMLAAVPGVSGSTLLSDGSVLLILDLTELAA